MLLREVDKKLNLTERIASVFKDPRCKNKIQHDLLAMLIFDSLIFKFQ